MAARGTPSAWARIRIAAGDACRLPDSRLEMWGWLSWPPVCLESSLIERPLASRMALRANWLSCMDALWHHSGMDCNYCGLIAI